jgi:dCMP deaminase
MNFENYTPPEWNMWFLQGVYWIASKSKDPKTKIGAIIVKDNRIISTGYNGMPHGIDDNITWRHDRPEKYRWFEHAERNAIYSAAKHGIGTQNASLYTNAMPCADCARGIIQSGIKQVYIHKQFSDLTESIIRDQWKGHSIVTKSMFNESEVKFFEIDVILGCTAYFDGKIYDV